MSSLRNSLTALLARPLLWLLAPPLAAVVPGWGRLCQWCGVNRDSGRYVSPRRLSAGLVIVLPGIEGPGPYSASLRAGLGDLPAAVTVHNWAGLWPGMAYAFNNKAARRRAERLVARIAAYRRAQPGRPVVLVGHSAGAAIAIFAAERLGAGNPLAGLIALATPLSPDYDLSAALAGARRLLACHSALDIQLHAMTAVAGNFDRRHGRTAGREGFARTHDGRVSQIAWDRSMIADGHWGGHVGWTTSPWVRRHLAPVVRDWTAFASAP